MVNLWFVCWMMINTGLVNLIKRNTSIFISSQHKHTWDALLQSDLVIVKGGAILFSHYGGLKDLLFLFRMLLTPWIALRLGKKVLFFRSFYRTN